MPEEGKFHKKFSGPYEVVEKVNDVIYKIRILEHKMAPIIQIQVNKLKLAPRCDENRWSDKFVN